MGDLLDDIFANDPLGLLNSKSRSSQATPDELQASRFREIQAFVKEHNRMPEPGSSNMTEYQLYSRLKHMREDEDLRLALEPLDDYGLLAPMPKAPESIEDIFSDGVSSGLLGIDEGEPNLFEFKHTPKEIERAEADFVAQRKPVKNFKQYGAMFKKVQRELREEKRSIIPFKQLDLQPGNFFIHNGILLFLESVDDWGVELGQGAVRNHSRTTVLFENGTMSNLLYSSLYKLLIMNGKTVTQTEDEAHAEFFENFGGVSDGDRHDGIVYICQSLSTDPQIASRKNLFKIGFTRGSMDFRIQNASESPTFLMADVKVVELFECFNINAQKLENLIHRFFDSARLRIDVFDELGNRYEPREWFEVPLPVVEQGIRLLISGEILGYVYDAERQVIVPR